MRMDGDGIETGRFMKNLSLRFALVAFVLVLVGAAIRGTITPVELAMFLSPLGVVTMLLSVKLHRTAAHVLNMIPTVIWLASPVVCLIDKDTGVLAFMYSLFFGPVLLAGVLMMWIIAWCVRGEEKLDEEDLQIRGRRPELVLPRLSPMNDPERKNSVKPT